MNRTYVISSNLIAPNRPRLNLEENDPALYQKSVAIYEEEKGCQRSLAHPYVIDLLSQSQEVLKETQSFTRVISVHSGPTFSVTHHCWKPLPTFQFFCRAGQCHDPVIPLNAHIVKACISRENVASGTMTLQ